MTFKKYKKKILEDPRSKKLNFVVDGRIHYVYRVSKDNKHYYGSRTDKDEPTIGRGYYTSSKYLEEDFRIDTESYKVKIIRSFDNPVDKMLFESYLHDYFDVKNHDSFINRANQTPFGFDVTGKKGINNPNTKEIYELDKNTGQVIEKWLWIKHINIKHGYCIDAISLVLRGKCKTMYDRVWCYADNYNEDLIQKIQNQIYNISGVNNVNSKPVYRIDEDTGNILEKFHCAQEANDAYDLNSVSNCCRKEIKKAGGKIWCFESDYNEIFKQWVINTDFSTSGDNAALAKIILRINPNNGKILEKFGCTRSAAKAICGLQTQISQAARDFKKRYKGYVWCYEKNYNGPFKQKVTNYSYGYRPTKAIYQFDLDTNEIIEKWDSARIASNHIKNTSQSSISNCARGISKSSGGYYWQYANSFTIEEQKSIEINTNTKDK